MNSEPLASSSSNNQTPNSDQHEPNNTHSNTYESAQTLKRRRITRACDRCHKGGIKCAASNDPSVCLPCASFGSLCTYDRPIKRRGPPAKRVKGERGDGDEGDHGNGNGDGEAVGGSDGGTAKRRGRGRGQTASDTPEDVPLLPRRRGDRHREDVGWRAEHVASSEVIEHLVEGYLRIVYPILPYFHWPTFSFDVRRRRYLHDRPFFASTMAVCAMSSARQRDGAKIPNFDTSLRSDIPPSQVFYNAAVNAFPKDLLAATDFDYKRAKALLTMISIQYGRVVEVKLHLGELCTMCSLEGFHSESRWPPGLNAIEVEERRRLFWAIYQLDIYASIIWGMMVSHRESQITVGYPTEVYEDEEITPSGFLPRRSGKGVSFLRGWNFVCDLYRIIEHATDRLRANRIGGTALDDVTGLYSRKGGPDPSEVLNVVAKLYNQLPVDFKRVNAMTGDLEKDRYGFTTTNIIITLQTLRSVVAGSEEANVHQRCTIAAEMLDAFASVPVSYIQAGSAPMLHHLAGVGHLLGSIIQSPLSQHSYLRVRTVLLALADMLATLEVALSSAPDIASRLRAHVSRIDNYMTEAALTQSNQNQIPMALPLRADAHPYLPSLLNFHPPPSDVRAEALPRPPVQSHQVHPPMAPTTLNSTSSSSLDHSTQISNLDDALSIAPFTDTMNPSDWAPPANISPTAQFTLPDDFFADWPFDFGQGDVFDWLGDVQAQSQVSGQEGAGYAGGEGGEDGGALP